MPLKNNWASGQSVDHIAQNDIANALNAVRTDGVKESGDRLSTYGLTLAQAAGIINF